jgi:hypothetical protein
MSNFLTSLPTTYPPTNFFSLPINFLTYQLLTHRRLCQPVVTEVQIFLTADDEGKFFTFTTVLVLLLLPTNLPTTCPTYNSLTIPTYQLPDLRLIYLPMTLPTYLPPAPPTSHLLYLPTNFPTYDLFTYLWLYQPTSNWRVDNFSACRLWGCTF